MFPHRMVPGAVRVVKQDFVGYDISSSTDRRGPHTYETRLGQLTTVSLDHSTTAAALLKYSSIQINNAMYKL